MERFGLVGLPNAGKSSLYNALTNGAALAAPYPFATKDPKIIWEGHYAGIDIPYSHMEKLRHLEQLPPFGFVVSCLPVKIKGASGGWIRAVAMFD